MQKARQSHEISICGDSKESLRKDRHNVLHERFSTFQSITTWRRLVAFLISLFLIVVGSKESHTNETRMCLSAPNHENPCDRREEQKENSVVRKKQGSPISKGLREIRESLPTKTTIGNKTIQSTHNVCLGNIQKCLFVHNFVSSQFWLSVRNSV